MKSKQSSPSATFLCCSTKNSRTVLISKHFYVEVSSEEAHTLVEEVRALDEVQRLTQRLIYMDVKVEEALAWVYEILGWGEPEKFKVSYRLSQTVRLFCQPFAIKQQL
jgi:hypothetical protein